MRTTANLFFDTRPPSTIRHHTHPPSNLAPKTNPSKQPTMRSISLGHALFLASVVRTAAGFSVYVPASKPINHAGATPWRPTLRKDRYIFPVLPAATSNDESTIQFVGKEQMEEILEDFEQGKSGYCVLDVRNEDEVESTGKLSKSIITCPLPKIKELHAFELHPEDFEEEFGFVKPHFDDTLVFTCAAGKRAQMAAELAATDGYPNIVVYAGGANEWFGPPSVEVP
jgi:rhodanese-related sulfurtransferase